MKRKLNNPFILTGYYGKEYFCNREEELTVLENHFNNERNVVLYAWRRLGKTALIQCFMAQLEENKSTETLYIDLLGTRNIEEAVLQITKAVYRKYGKTSSGISASLIKLFSSIGIEMSFDPQTGNPAISLGLKNFGTYPNQSLEALGNFLKNKKKPILIAIDEFQQIKHYPEQNGEAVFRGWMQQFPAIRFIFCGSHRNIMQSMFTEKNRPFYQSAQLLQLMAIDFNEYKAFIQYHFKSHKKEISEDAIQQIYDWSRQQTYCIQLICNRLFGSVNKVEITHLQSLFDEILKEESAVFSNYTNLLTDAQWRVLQAIAKEEPLYAPTASDFINKYKLGASSTVSTAMNKLMETEIVIKEADKFLVHDVLLARWLQSL